MRPYLIDLMEKLNEKIGTGYSHQAARTMLDVFMSPDDIQDLVEDAHLDAAIRRAKTGGKSPFVFMAAFSAAIAMLGCAPRHMKQNFSFRNLQNCISQVSPDGSVISRSCECNEPWVLKGADGKTVLDCRKEKH